MSSDITLYGSDGNPVVVTGDEMKVHGIESGSNTNGTWIKFPDGTLICTRTYFESGLDVSNAYGSLFESENIGPFTYPAEFVSFTPTLTFGLLKGSGCTIYCGISPSNNKIETPTIKLVRPIVDTLDMIITYQAIGRWK